MSTNTDIILSVVTLMGIEKIQTDHVHPVFRLVKCHFTRCWPNQSKKSFLSLSIKEMSYTELYMSSLMALYGFSTIAKLNLVFKMI